MERVTSFLLASGPLWSPPSPTRSWLPHSQLYSSPKRFLVESHLFAGVLSQDPKSCQCHLDTLLPWHCSQRHGLGLSRCSTAASNTILGLCSKGLSRHVLPHVAPGFFDGRGHRGWWSSPNFASIHLVPRDDILALCSGIRTQSQCMTILSSGAATVFSLGLASQGSRMPINS
jgi:hypothetical protein